jgi:hypothetical protein
MAAAGKYLVIVRRGETEVFRSLVEHFGTGPDATAVIWDRRVRDRRVIIQDRDPERRKEQRRAPVDATMWTERGFVVIRVDRPGAEAPRPSIARRPGLPARARNVRKPRGQGELRG